MVPGPRVSKFLISRDVKFDQSAMFHMKKKSSVDTSLEKLEDVKKQVEFETDDSVSLQKGLFSPSDLVQVHDGFEAKKNLHTRAIYYCYKSREKVDKATTTIYRYSGLCFIDS